MLLAAGVMLRFKVKKGTKIGAVENLDIGTLPCK
jgi:hypothetical protein